MSRSLELNGQRFGRLVVVERTTDRILSSGVKRIQYRCVCDCGGEALVTKNNLMNKSTVSCGCRHREAAIENGRANRRSHVSYSRAHRRVYETRGNPGAHTCVDCDRVAEEWSYTHGSDDERVDHNHCGSAVVYSLNPDDYSPRCKSCHRAADAARRKMSHGS